MYLVVIAWMYVVLMMSIAEATNSNGTLLGALFTFLLYGVGPVTLVVYLMGAPKRSKAIKKREAQARVQSMESMAAASQNANPPMPSVEPDTGGHASGRAEAVPGNSSIAPVGKEP